MRRRKFLQLSAMTVGASMLPLFGVHGAASGKPATQAVPVGLDPKLSVHPMLQYGAIVEPDKKVRVLVQKRHKEGDGHAIAHDAGATHLEQFAFIKSHSMEMAQKNVMKLGRHKDVLYVSPDGPAQRHSIDTSMLKTIYPIETNAAKVWNASGGGAATGNGVTVAVIDTGVANHPDLANVTQVNVNAMAASANDVHGHGTHVAGIIAGRNEDKRYLGIAPDARIIGIKIADDQGAAHTSDLLRGLQWVYDHRATVGVVNLSVTAGIAESYKTSPIAAAAELLWSSGVVVVVAAGNRGAALDATFYAPANDPYVITVGGLDDNGTVVAGDDSLGTFSSRGNTQDGIYKPDLVAPGRKIVSTLASGSCTLAQTFPARITDSKYLRLSGTSMAAPVVTGAVALLLQRFPTLSPDQIKGLLLSSASSYSAMPDTAKAIDALTAMNQAKSGAISAANQGLTPSIGINPINVTAAPGNAYWDNAYWDNAYWDNAYWDVLTNYD